MYMFCIMYNMYVYVICALSSFLVDKNKMNCNSNIHLNHHVCNCNINRVVPSYLIHRILRTNNNISEHPQCSI